MIPEAETILVAWAGGMGLICGSFANVLVHRLPRGVFLSMGRRSRCPYCGTMISWHDNLPLVSWLLLRGRCRRCRAPIRLRYPLVEALCGLLFLLVALGAWTGPEPGGWGFALTGFFLALWLTTGSVIDLEHRILPDSLTLSGLALAPLLVFGNPAGPGWPGTLVAGWPGVLLGSGAGMVAGGGALWLVGVLGRAAFHKEAMGSGDVKLNAFLGGVLGAGGVLLAFFIACLTGALFGLLRLLARGDHYLPFGPFLAGGAFLVFLAGERVRSEVLGAVDWFARSGAGPLAMAALAGGGLVLMVFLRRVRQSEGDG